MTAYKGGSLSAMYGLGYKRAPEGAYIVEKDGSITNVSGQIIVDENGYPQYSDELQYIGECTPDWKGGFGTSVKWKGLTVSVAFDGQHGGNVYSYTNAVLGTRGKGSFTLAGRYDGLVLDGVTATSFAIPTRQPTSSSTTVWHMLSRTASRTLSAPNSSNCARFASHTSFRASCWQGASSSRDCRSPSTAVTSIVGRSSRGGIPRAPSCAVRR